MKTVPFVCNRVRINYCELYVVVIQSFPMKGKTIKAYAKINLGLDVVGRRDNGYHDVDMIMQTIDIHDIVGISCEEVNIADNRIYMGVSQHSYGEELSGGDDNLCIKAAKALLEATGTNGYDIDISLEKHIPIAAGMAGGSTDAAAVLILLNELCETGLFVDELCGIGVKLGADIPFCIRGGCMRAQGIGEELRAISPVPEWDVLIAKPPIAVSTAEVYKRSDAAMDVRHPDIDALEQAIVRDDIMGACSVMGNVLEAVTRDMHPVIGEIEATMAACGAIRAMMTGSGPTVFGIYPNSETCEKAAEVLKEKGLCPEVFATKTR